jgi:hypothetical protein
MRRSFKAFIKPDTNLKLLSKYIKDSLKDDISITRGEGWKDHGLVLNHSKAFSQKVRITLTIERLKYQVLAS